MAKSTCALPLSWHISLLADAQRDDAAERFACGALPPKRQRALALDDAVISHVHFAAELSLSKKPIGCCWVWLLHALSEAQEASLGIVIVAFSNDHQQV